MDYTDVALRNVNCEAIVPSEMEEILENDEPSVVNPMELSSVVIVDFTTRNEGTLEQTNFNAVPILV